MLNYIPILGWLIDLIFKMFLAIPFWIIWDLLNVGKNFFNFLPQQFHVIGFWNTVGLFIVLGIIKAVVVPLGLMRLISK